MLTRIFGPHADGRLYWSQLERVVRKLDFGGICAEEGPKLFIRHQRPLRQATRFFEEQDSGQCHSYFPWLATLFQAAEIIHPTTSKTDSYWDGGYSGNAGLFPLFDPELPDDIVVVHIKPLCRDVLPTSP